MLSVWHWSTGIVCILHKTIVRHFDVKCYSHLSLPPPQVMHRRVISLGCLMGCLGMPDALNVAFGMQDD
jgi:hypothetical protein